MNDLILNELLTRMSDAELRNMNNKIEKILNGESIPRKILIFQKLISTKN